MPVELILRGDQWQQLGEWDKAIKEYTNTVKLDPKSYKDYIIVT